MHAHGHSKDACLLAVQLAEELLAHPPELMIDVPPLISRGKRKKVKSLNKVLPRILACECIDTNIRSSIYSRLIQLLTKSVA